MHHQLYIEIWISGNVICTHCWIVWNETTAQLTKFCVFFCKSRCCVWGPQFDKELFVHRNIFFLTEPKWIVACWSIWRVARYEVTMFQRLCMLWFCTIVLCCQKFVESSLGWKSAKETNLSSEFGLLLKQETPEQCSFPLVSHLEESSLGMTVNKKSFFGNFVETCSILVIAGLNLPQKSRASSPLNCARSFAEGYAITL